MKRILALLILAAATLGAQNLTTSGNLTSQASACVANGSGALNFDRANPTLIALCTAIGQTSAQIDALFVLAGSL